MDSDQSSSPAIRSIVALWQSADKFHLLAPLSLDECCERLMSLEERRKYFRKYHVKVTIRSLSNDEARFLVERFWVSIDSPAEDTEDLAVEGILTPQSDNRTLVRGEVQVGEGHWLMFGVAGVFISLIFLGLIVIDQFEPIYLVLPAMIPATILFVWYRKQQFKDQIRRVLLKESKAKRKSIEPFDGDQY